ncbi:MAG: WXG100 family type VII secretion target [Actinobacteria bacterium]|nr:WXG100 family type VII secretion target [Actinomycetota bacterium]
MTGMMVRSSEVLALATSITEAGDDIAATLERLQTAVDRLAGGWSGDAQRAYAVAQAKWTAEMAEIRAITQVIGAETAQWAEHFIELEQRHAQGWPV